MKAGTLYCAMFMLFAVASSAVAQPDGGLPPTANMNAEIHASVATTKADEKISRATREQIQALRLALKAKLAAMRH